MHDQTRQVHRWLFGVAIGLTVLAVPHAAVVYARHLPAALVNLHLTTTVGLYLYAELRRQYAEFRRQQSERSRIQGDLTELVAAVERR